MTPIIGQLQSSQLQPGDVFTPAGFEPHQYLVRTVRRIPDGYVQIAAVCATNSTSVMFDLLATDRVDFG